MSGAPDLGTAPTRISIDVELVHRLIADQFPHWSHEPIRAVANGGWDNWTFHLGSQMTVRLPSGAEYALAVEKEHRWLPELAAQLPLPIPTPLGKGEPSEAYPFAWSIYRWLDGEPAAADRIADSVRFALDLAGLISALQRIDPADGPAPGTHNWFRGGSLRTFDGTTQDALEALRGRIDAELARQVWAAALSARWDSVPLWFHGDIAEGNLLLDDGQLCAVIDFGTCGVGDPACDLAGAWTLLDAAGRLAFRERLTVDEDTWARGRGWALWKTLTTYAQALPYGDDATSTSRRVLETIFEEYETQP